MIQQQTILQIIFASILLAFVQNQQLNCGIGCLSCQSVDQIVTCSECSSGFKLDPLLQNCVYQNCDNKMIANFYQVNGVTQVQCVAVCPSNTIANYQQLVCKQIQQCSQSFTGAAQLTDEVSVTDFGIYEQQYIVLLYDTSLNIANLVNGKFEQTIQYPNNTIKARIVNGYIVLMDDQNNVSTLDINTGNVNKIGVFNGILSQPLQIAENELFFFLATIFQQQIMYINAFSYTSPTQILPLQISMSLSQAHLYGNYLVQLNNGDGVTVQQLSIVQNSIQVTKIIPQNIYCSDSSGALLSNLGDITLFKAINSQFLVSFSKYSFIFTINPSVNSCTLSISTPNPMNIIGVLDQQQKPQALVIQYNNQIAIYDMTYKLIQSISYAANSISDISTYLPLNNPQVQLQLHVLSQNTVDIYYTSALTNIFFKLNISLQIKIDSPLNLMVFIPQSNSLVNLLQPTLFIYNYDFSAINLTTNTIEYMLEDIQTINQPHQASITCIVSTSKQQFLISGDSNGTIVIWETLNKYEGVVYYTFAQVQETCSQLITYLDRYIFSLFISQVVIIDIYNPINIIKISIPQSTYSTFIVSSSTFVILNLGGCVAVYNQNPPQQAFQYCDSTLQKVSDIAISYNNQFLVRVSSVIYYYQINFSTNSLTLLQTYPFPTQIVLYKVRLYSSNSQFKLAIVDSSFNFYTINSSFQQEINLQIQSLNSVIDLSFPVNTEQENYILLGYNSNPQIHFSFQFFMISGSQQSYSYIFSIQYASKIFDTFVDTTSDGELAYRISSLMAFSTVSLIYQFSYYSTSERIESGVHPINVNQYFTYCLVVSNSNERNAYCGAQSGFIGCSQLFRNLYYQTYAINPSVDQPISTIQQSLSLERYFIISNNVYIYNIHTDQQVEQITFSNNQNGQVKQVMMSEKMRIISFIKDYEIHIRNYANQSNYDSTNLGYIAGVLLDDIFQRIIIYGANGINVIQPNQINSPQTMFSSYSFQQCIMSTTYFICKVATSSVIIVQRQSLSKVSLFNIFKQDPNFMLQYDETYQNVFAYYVTVYVYDIFGNLSNILNDPTLEIFQFNFCGDSILLTSSLVIYVYDRASLSNKLILSSASSGTIEKTFYLPTLNFFGYYSNSIRSGQIIFYNLAILVNTGTYINQTNQVIGAIISVIDDSLYEELHTVDAVGNINNVAYQSTLSIDNSLQMGQLFKQQPPSLHQLDFNSNTVLLGNQQNIYRINYNIFFQTFEQYSTREVNFSVSVVIDSTTYILIADNKNVIYQYSNFEQTYLVDFPDQILDIFQLTQPIYFGIAFANKILIYQTSKASNNFKITLKLYNTITGYSYRCLICDFIFLTFDNKLVNYDYLSGILNYAQQIQYQQDQITHKICANELNLIILAFYSGRIALFKKNVVNFQYISNSSLMNLPIKSVLYNQSQIILGQINGDIVTIALSSYQVTKISKSSYIQNEPNLDLQSLSYDSNYNRYFLWYQLQKKCFVLSSTFSLVQFISFPDDFNNKLQYGNSVIILYSTSQMSFYTRDKLQFLFSIRLQKTQKIKQITLLNDSILTVVYINQINVFSLNLSNMSYQFIDNFTLPFPNQVLLSSIQNGSFLQLIGYSQYTLFDKLYSLSLLQSQDNQCMSTITVNDSLQTQQLFNSIYQPNQNLQYVMYFQLTSQIELIRQINSNNTAQYIFSSVKSGKSQNLYLKSNSLAIIQKPIVLTQFSFIFQDKGQYYTSSQSQQVTIDNSNFQNQDIYSQSLVLKNKTSVLFNQININNLNMHNNNTSNKQRILQNFQYYLNQYQELIQVFDSQELIIYNLNIFSNNFDTNCLLLHVRNVSNVVIKNLNISWNTFKQLMLFENVGNLVIENLIISQNAMIKDYKISSSDSCYVFQLMGIQTTSVQNVTITNNLDIGIIQTNNIYYTPAGFTTLISDIFQITNGTIRNNRFPSNSEIIYTPMLQLSNSVNQLSELNVQQNESNLQIIQCNSATITSSNFINNKAINGGALQGLQISTELSIVNSTFSQNEATSSGGAIYLSSIQNVQIDSLTKLFQNKALIGGAIRYFSVSQSNFQSIQKSQMASNVGSIYGDGITNYLVTAEIKMITEFQVFQKTYVELPLMKYQPFLKVENFQPGGNATIVIKLIDEEGKYLRFDPAFLENNFYPQEIINELIDIQIQFKPKNTQSLLLSDQSIVNYLQYDTTFQAFIKSNLLINLNLSDEQYLFIYIEVGQIFPSIEVQINSRSCIVGEVLKQYSSAISICADCPYGFYSIVQYGQVNSVESSSMQQCKKCPDSAVYCEEGTISIKNGYWRKNNLTDEILLCSQNQNNCVAEQNNNKQGCLSGHIGPLCEECDFGGRVWGKRYTKSLGVLECQQCISQSLIIFYFILVCLIILSYFFAQLISFMNGYYHTQICFYLRKLSIIPISYSSVRGQANFYMKVLTNYIQILAIIQNFSISFLPSVIIFGPNTIGSVVQQSTGILNCLYPSEYIINLGQGRLQLISQSLLPFLLIVILYLSLEISKKFKFLQIGKFHKYTLLSFVFFFIQPDSLSLFSKALSCRSIGSNSYYTLDLNYDCYDQKLKLFTLIFSLPNLLFWLLMPLIPLYCLYKRKEKLDYCMTRLKYGYFFSEYKDSYYYWEFYRIYLKISIVLLFTFLQENQLTAITISNMLIFVYMYSIVKCKPFWNYGLQKFEKLSYFVLAVLMILYQLYQQYQQQIFIVFYVIINLLFLCLAVFHVIYQKLNNSFNFFGKCFQYILKKCVPQSSQKYFKNNSVSLSTFQKWRKIRASMKSIITLRPFLYQNQTLREDSVQHFKSQVNNFQQRFSVFQSNSLQNKVSNNYSNDLLSEKELIKIQSPSKSSNKDEIFSDRSGDFCLKSAKTMGTPSQDKDKIKSDDLDDLDSYNLEESETNSKRMDQQNNLQNSLNSRYQMQFRKSSFQLPMNISNKF